jgi:hypothetical protein
MRGREDFRWRASFYTNSSQWQGAVFSLYIGVYSRLFAVGFSLGDDLGNPPIDF